MWEVEVVITAINKGINQRGSQLSSFLFLQHLLWVSQNVILRKQASSKHSALTLCPRTSIPLQVEIANYDLSVLDEALFAY